MFFWKFRVAASASWNKKKRWLPQLECFRKERKNTNCVGIWSWPYGARQLGAEAPSPPRAHAQQHRRARLAAARPAHGGVTILPFMGERVWSRRAQGKVQERDKKDEKEKPTETWRVIVTKCLGIAKCLKYGVALQDLLLCVGSGFCMVRHSS